VLATLAVPAFAAEIDPAIIKATAGYWFLAEAKSGTGCNLRLYVDKAIGGHAVDAPRGCMVARQPAAAITAWNFDDDGLMILLDPTRHVLFHLKEQEHGAWTEDAPDGNFSLTPSERDVVAIPVAGDLAATWVMKRPDGPDLCRVTLAGTPPPGGEESFALTVAEGCDPTIASLAFASWRIEGAAVVLHGTEGRSLAFLADGKGGLFKAPREGGRPLLMVKAP
jgi:hypothetical protein